MSEVVGQCQKCGESLTSDHDCRAPVAGMSDTPAEQIARALVGSYLWKCAMFPLEHHSPWLSEEIAAVLERQSERIRELEGEKAAAQSDLQMEMGERVILEQQPKWVCFHCEFATSDPKEAANHFGDRDDEAPVCVTWGSLDADGRASEYQSTLGELNAERDENAKLRTENEGLEYRLLEYESLVGSRFKGCRSINDAFNLYDSMEGRALAAEQANRELLEALQVWIDDFGGRPISEWNAADGERVQGIVNRARAALSKHGGTR